MSYEEKLETVTLLAGADYSGTGVQYKFVTVSGADTFLTTSVAGADSFGVMQDRPILGEASCIAIGGISKVRVGAAISVGASVTSGSDGKAITATTGNRIMGIALAAATAADQIIPVKLDKNGIA